MCPVTSPPAAMLTSAPSSADNTGVAPAPTSCAVGKIRPQSTRSCSRTAKHSQRRRAQASPRSPASSRRRSTCSMQLAAPSLRSPTRSYARGTRRSSPASTATRKRRVGDGSTSAWTTCTSATATTSRTPA
eukprot:2227134-Prymnesium_polylepis.1